MTVFDVIAEGYRGQGTGAMFPKPAQPVPDDGLCYFVGPDYERDRVVFAPAGQGALFIEREAAERVRADLESRGFRAWIDSRTIPDPPPPAVVPHVG